jgi:UDP-2,4-diacetamido-2,4,6-trideoxy-beta-L-altropyranose hydrolase
MTTILFRADASHSLGSGHVMRCLTLAKELTRRGARVLFASRPIAGNWLDRIVSAGFPLVELPVAAKEGSLDQEVEAGVLRAALNREGLRPDWLVVDHYRLDATWETELRSAVGRILVIDDLADRRHDCDVLLDSALLAPERYARLVPPDCRQLLGPQFALLRPEFAEERQRQSVRGEQVRRIVVSFGGTDPTHETLKALQAIERLNRPDLEVDCVAGRHFPHLAEIRDWLASRPRFRLCEDLPGLAPLFARADLFVGAGGGTTWERCCLGLPALVISVAENQEHGTKALAAAGAQVYLGRSQDVSAADVTRALEALLADAPRRASLARRAAELVDGQGAERVADAMLTSQSP